MFLALLKVNINGLFAGMFHMRKRLRKKSPVMPVLIVLLAIYAIGALMFMFGMMFNGICGMFFAGGIGWFYFTMVALVSFALCFIGSIFITQNLIFSAKDNSILLALPVKPSYILMGRIATLLIFDCAIQALVFVPALAVWIMNGSVTAAGVILFALSSLLLPLLSATLACLVGWLITLATSKMRNKNIFTLVLSLAFLVAYFYVYSNITKYMNILIAKGAEIADAVRKALFPAYHFGMAAAGPSVISFIIFALCATAPFILMIFILSTNFIKLSTSNRGANKKRYRQKALTASGVAAALMKKDLRRYLSNPLYIMNATLGSFAFIALAVVMLVRPSLITSLISPYLSLVPGLSMGFLAMAALSLLATMNTTTAPSVSLEGKSLWIVKSLPVKASSVLLSKLNVHLLVCGVPALAAGLACAVALPLSGLGEAALIVVMPVVMTVAVGLLGLCMNILFPRFDWTNEMQPIKQSLSVVVTMFGAMAFVVAAALIYMLGLSGVMSLNLFMLLCTVLLAALSGLMLLYITRGGSRRFEEMAG